MGLDITAYKNVKLVENPKMGDTNHPEVWGNQVYINIKNIIAKTNPSKKCALFCC